MTDNTPTDDMASRVRAHIEQRVCCADCLYSDDMGGTPERAVIAVLERHSCDGSDLPHCREDATPWPCRTVRDLFDALQVAAHEEVRRG